MERLDLLILAAFEPELAPLRAAAALGPGLAGRLSGRTVAARAVGIGMPSAAAGAATALAELGAGTVVLVGTCGAYRGAGLAIGDVIVANVVRVADVAAAEGRAEFPAPMVTSLPSDSRLRLELARSGARPAHVATTLGITVDDASAARVAQATGSQVEHLEAFGVATACAARGIFSFSSRC